MTSESTPDEPAGAALPASRSQPATLPLGGAVIASWLRSANVSVLREVALLPVLALLLIVGTVRSPVFLTVSNFSGIGEQSSALGVVVVGESLILMIGGMDLSLESTYGLAPMVAAWLIVPVAAYGNGLDLNPYLGILVLIAVGAAAAARRPGRTNPNRSESRSMMVMVVFSATPRCGTNPSVRRSSGM